MNRARAGELGVPHPERIRAVAFDAVGTLIFPDPPVAAVYGEIGKRHGSQRAGDDVARRFRDAFALAERETPTDRAAWDRPDVLRCDEPGERARWGTIVATVLDDADDPQACFDELFAHFARPAAWTVYPDVMECLAELKARGYRTAVASNFDARLVRLLRDLPGLQDVDVPLISSLVGYRKPSRFFYDAAAAALRLPPQELLVVGDDWENDVEGARRAGLQAVFLDRQAATRPTSAIHSLRELLSVLDARTA
ncbi:MAG: HAD-IA family hydrolase [Planctomycetales bacterium]